MSGIYFETPLALLLLLPIIILAIWRYRSHPAARVSLPTLPWLDRSHARSAKLLTLCFEAARLIFFAGLVLVLARPQSGTVETERLTEGIDIMLAIDTSESMKAMDFMRDKKRVNRLEVVKSVAADFVGNRNYDRVGIVVFGDHAFTQCPPTYDHDSVVGFLDWLFIGMAGSRTAIGSAIAIGTKRLENLPGKSKVMILLTDGRSTVNDINPLEAAKVAASLGVKIYTIGVGSQEPVPVPVDSIFGTRLVKQRLELDEELLKQIAFSTDGLYFNAQDTEALKAIYARIDELEKSEVKIKQYRNYEEIYLSWLQPLMVLFIIMLGLDCTLLRKIP